MQLWKEVIKLKWSASTAIREQQVNTMLSSLSWYGVQLTAFCIQVSFFWKQYTSQNRVAIGKLTLVFCCLYYKQVLQQKYHLPLIQVP